MDISNWTKPEVVQLMEQYIMQPTKSLEELQREIQQITGKSLNNSSLRFHLQQFQKETAAYKQLNNSKEQESKSPKADADVKKCDKSSKDVAATLKECEIAAKSGNFQTGCDGAGETPGNRTKESEKSTENYIHVPEDSLTARSSSSAKQHRRITAHRRQELQITRSYQKRRFRRTRNKAPAKSSGAHQKATTNGSVAENEQNEGQKEEEPEAIAVSAEPTTTPTETKAVPSEPTVVPNKYTVTPDKPAVLPVEAATTIAECPVIPASPLAVLDEATTTATAFTAVPAEPTSPTTEGPPLSWNNFPLVKPNVSDQENLRSGTQQSDSVLMEQEDDIVSERTCLLSSMMPQGNLVNQQFQSMTTHLDHCLNAVRLLRNEVIAVHRRIMAGSLENDPADGEKTLEERLDFINQIYDNLESHAKQLPTGTPMTVQMERMSRFLHDGHIDPHTSELYNKTLDASTWMETNNQLLQMYAEFLRTVVGNRRRSIMTDRPISYSNYGPNSSPQSIFEQTLAAVLKDPNNKKIGLVGRYLEKSTLTAIVEFKFGQVVDKQYVCLLKMLMVVNSGVPEFVQMIAPHEEWSYLDVGFGQVDIHKESRYLVYRKMSIQANIHLMQTIVPCIDIRNAHTLSYILNLFSKFSGVFDTKCRVCKKIMKDYLPPLMFDLRCPKNALHESCR